MKLRHELLHFPTSDGGLELVDLLLEQRHTFSPDEAKALKEDPGPELRTRLNKAMLLEGPVADAIRQGARHGRTRMAPSAPDFPDLPEGPWSLASTLPEWITPAWHRPERWRRLAEDYAAGRMLLRLDQLIEPDHAMQIRNFCEGLAFEQRHTAYVQGSGHELTTDAFPSLLEPLHTGPLHTLFGALLGDALPSRMFTRVWRLGEGDHIGLHKDGIHYAATVSLGLCPHWTASHGGAIAFGEPEEGGMRVRQRWLPHLGDVMLFRPTALAWHNVEPVRKDVRFTLTGHYVTAQYPGA